MTDTTTETRYRIGQVCDLLREDFPDISISKLRFLQDKGIVEPARTASGYRMYSERDVEALRVALHMQRDQFMPLRVIREELGRMLANGGPRPGAAAAAAGSGASAAASADAASAAPRRVAGSQPAAGAVRLGVEEQLVSAEAVARSAGVTHEFLEECRAADIVTGRRDSDGTTRYTQDEAGLIAMAGTLHTLGLDVRHLRQASSAMSRQGAIVEQYASAILRAPGDEARERGLRTVEDLTTQLAEFLRIAFVRDVKLMTARATGGAGRESAAGRIAAPLI